MSAEMDLDIVQLLHDEHEDLRSLFEEVLDAEPLARREPFRYLVARLAAHEAAEEAIVHRAVSRELPDGTEAAQESLEQEAAAERQLAKMEDLDPDSAEFVTALEALRAEVLAHAEHEETEEFPLLEKHLSVTRRRELAEEFQVLRNSGPTRPHPLTPQRPTVRALTGPIAGVFDRARDTARELLGR